MFSAWSGHCTVVGAFKHVTTWCMGFILFVCFAIACEPEFRVALLSSTVGPPSPGIRMSRCVLREAACSHSHVFLILHTSIFWPPSLTKWRKKRTGIQGYRGDVNDHCPQSAFTASLDPQQSRFWAVCLSYASPPNETESTFNVQSRTIKLALSISLTCSFVRA